MKYEVITTDSFEKAAKPLLKKYPSLKNELAQLENDLQTNPRMGTALGKNTFKIRLAISSKGKSGGARVITHLELNLEVEEESTDIFLLTIYDKSVAENITDKELEILIKERNK